MRRTYAYFISLLLLISNFAVRAQDTIMFPLKIRAGFDVSGPVIHFTDKNNMSLEGFISFDKSEKMAFIAEGGYLNYKYSQYNYDYRSNGIFMRAGVDFNLLKPGISKGKYQAGVGLRYGLSFFSSETPFFDHTNYWGDVTSSINKKMSIGHFLELTPQVRAELFRNVSIGWTIRLRLLISGGGGKDLPPIYFPGFGTGGKRTNAGFNYYLIWNFRFKTKRLIIKPEPPEEPEEPETKTGAQQTF